VKPLTLRHLALLGAVVAVVACGDVPTLENGIAYISAIQLPAPAVAAGDTLRDSLGRVTPVTVVAYDRSNLPIPGVEVNYVITTLPAGINIDSSGVVTGFDSIRTVQFVARVGSRLQTEVAQLEVVAQPDTIVQATSPDSIVAATPSGPLTVNVTGPRRGLRVPVKGIVVHYRIAALYPTRPVDSTLVFFPNGQTTAVDTTTAVPGSASRTVILSSTTGVDSVAVNATANNLRGKPLGGSPVRFVLHVKKGS
jgi:hypothetical protein